MPPKLKMLLEMTMLLELGDRDRLLDSLHLNSQSASVPLI